MWEIEHIRLLASEHCGWFLAERSVRSDVVVMRPPIVDGRACVVETGEPVQIEAILAELTIEALDEGVLRRLAGLNEVQLYTGPL